MKITARKSFLVFTGGNDRAVLAFLRVLRVCDERAHIIARTVEDRILRTTFSRNVRWVRPTHALSLEVIAEAIKRVRITAGSSTLVILPSTEYLNLFLLEHRARIESMGCEIPLVDKRLYVLLTAKWASINFFAEAGIDHPCEIDPGKGPMVPVVAKPRVNVSSSGESLYPHLFESRQQLVSFMQNHDAHDWFFQELVTGDSVYLLFYIDQNGHDIVWSQHNLLQQPDGKSMLLAEASDFHHSTTATRMLNALHQSGFHGLGMIEVIRSGSRDVFIEMNPRIWGPIQFCADQHHPLLQAFIGKALYDDPVRFLPRSAGRRRQRYFWFGGLLETARTKKRPVWHVAPRSLWSTVIHNIAFDVYLRSDSWRSFIRDLVKAPQAGRVP